MKGQPSEGMFSTELSVSDFDLGLQSPRETVGESGGSLELAVQEEASN